MSEYDMPQDTASDKEVEFYKKRFEIAGKEREVLKDENKILRQELDSMKGFVKKIVMPKKNDTPGQTSGIGKEDVMTILEFQRKKIDELERELSNVKAKYEKAIFANQKGNHQPESIVQMQNETSTEGALMRANERVNHLEMQVKELTSTSAKEIVTLKQRLVENNATLILSNVGTNNLANNFDKSPLRSPSLTMVSPGLNSNRESKKRLEPIKSSTDIMAERLINEDEERARNAKLFAYRKDSTKSSKKGVR